MSYIGNAIDFLSSQQFMPHGYCYHWIPSLVWLHVLSDGVIALSYFMIPLTLIYFVRKRNDLAFSWMFIAFGAFIITCGMTHVMSIWTLWYANYWVSGFVKVITAIVSFATAVLLIRIIPAALAMPNQAALKKMNSQLETSESKLSSILEGAPDAMVVVFQNGTIDSVNAQVEKVFGYTKQELIGQSIEMLIPDRYRQLHMQHRQHYYKNPHVRSMGEGMELYGLRKDGSEFPVEIGLSPVNAGGEHFALAAIRDITQKKKVADELVSKNVQLNNANNAKDQFLTHMSHELRTPLNGIISMTDMLLTSDVTLDQKEQLEIIQESNQQLLKVINTILDFSKLEAGDEGVECVEYDVRGHLEKIIAPYKLKARDKGIALIMHIDKDVPQKCYGDIAKLRQVLANLLDNAVKFTEHGKIELQVGIHSSGNNQYSLIFRVSDTGIGIAPAMHKKLFKPFTQGDSSMTRKYGGTGLGLTICKKLVNLMGGEISIQNSEAGCVVEFSIPCIDRSSIIQDLDARPVVKEEVMSGDHSGTILLVEDNKTNQKATSILLKKLGYRLDIANDGIEALSKYATHPFDLILIDVQMPNMDGYETTMRIRKMDEKRKVHIPIIGVTAHAMAGNREKCLEAGMDDYISKPYENRELAELIAKYIKA